MIATDWLPLVFAWGVAAVAFITVLAALLVYRNRSITQLQKAIRPIFPTPAEALNSPI